ncbi:hypothetical protein GQ43DRAFT_444817 [Delitschia confertaspora ATCC 74209]|uniref:Uncharacterized protein n=1 Tax=Delitschia confertaspora ATCC 74209 TaxID=1513339 RepID=A0A9P4MNA0_9PLEO|nr:hypothetical protein GQ43DRAFT_444817 [Delitschia confertaspora ATCC 74209]
MAMRSGREPSTPWLAMTFGCCASPDNYENDERAVPSQSSNEMLICYDQPQLIPQPRAEPEYPRPSTSHSMVRHVSQWVEVGRDFASRASTRTSIATISKPRKSHTMARPSISRPTDFRRFDGVNDVENMLEEAPMPTRRRRSFRPLELSIYQADGRLSPLPDFTNPEWSALPAELEMPEMALVRDRDSRTNSVASISTSTYLIQRKPISTASRRSSIQSCTSASLPVSIHLLQKEDQPQSRPDSLINPSIHRSSTQKLMSHLSSPSPSRARSHTSPAPSALLSPPISTRGSLRRSAPRTDIDEAIRELNTIVEERRADAYRSANQSPAFTNRPPPSPSHHVPLIAPSLRLHVRSETLSDIGSAFSVPLAHKPLPTLPMAPRGGTKLRLLEVPERSMPGPLNSNPITPPTPTVPSSSISRLGAWLKRSIPSTPTTPSFRKSTTLQLQPSIPATPFYQCATTPSVPAIPFQITETEGTASRPSTAGSRTLAHVRQDSNDTATLLCSSYPSTPSLTSRAASFDIASPQTPGTIKTIKSYKSVEKLKGNGKVRRVPKMLDLSKDKEIEAGLSGLHPAERGFRSPAWDALKGMDIPISPDVVSGASPVAPVGVAF